MTIVDEEKVLVFSESVREKNFDSFKKKYGFRPKIDPKEADYYSLGTSLSGEPVLYVNNSPNTIRLNSIYSPSFEAKMWAEGKAKPNRRTTIAVFGFSTGVFLRALIEAYRPDTTFFVYEPNEGFFSYVCGCIDITDIIESDRISLFVSDEQRAMFSEKLIHDITTVRPEGMRLSTPFYAASNDFIEACDAVKRMMVTNSNYMKSRGRGSLRARLYAWNHMQTEHVLPDLRTRIPKGMPAIIVAAGPSLQKNVEELKRAKGKCLIICTDRAASVLDKYGIIPDIVSSFDTIKASEYLKVDILKGVPLLCSYQVNVDTQKLFRDRMIFMHALSYENKLFGNRVGGRDKGIDLGGNVAGGSFMACEMLGITTIILIGQDLAFQGEKHHADSVDEGVGPSNLKEVQGINGELVKTNEMWLSFKEFYERQKVINPELRIIDATEGGALIKGSEIMSLCEAIDTVCTTEYDISGIFCDLPSALDRDGYEETKRILREWINDLDMIRNTSVELVDLCNGLLKICKYQDITDVKVKSKLKRLEEMLTRIYVTESYRMLKEFWIEDMYSVPDRQIMLRSNEEAIPVLDSLISFFEHLPTDCVSLKEEIEKSLQQD